VTSLNEKKLENDFRTFIVLVIGVYQLQFERMCRSERASAEKTVLDTCEDRELRNATVMLWIVEYTRHPEIKEILHTFYFIFLVCRGASVFSWSNKGGLFVILERNALRSILPIERGVDSRV
jgi:hypothetical protein